LAPILNLGEQHLTGIFPKTEDRKLDSGPLELVKCEETEANNSCGLLQLKQSYDSNDIYGMDYGYRSGLNQSMVKHLKYRMDDIRKRVSLSLDDIVLDIGSNDGTFLKAFGENSATLVGMDPTGKKFKEYYPDYVQLIPDFLSADSFRRTFGDKKAKVITSIAMFYDLEDPLSFMQQVHDILADDGIWVAEQSYMPLMMERNAYDTICHEHLEYYRLKQLKWMADKIGFKIIDIELNDVNGGSFCVTAAKTNSRYPENTKLINELMDEEKAKALDTRAPYQEFRQRVYQHRDDLNNFIRQTKSENKKIIGYGASTKGNVVLQFCGLTRNDIPYIAEVNEDKFGSFTPGTRIPIISEDEARKMNPDYFLVLPWHFKENILSREKAYLESGGKFLFPLPTIEVV